MGTAVDLMHRAVLRQQAHSRQGTASTLARAEVRGGGRKPYKQKGTGRARQGSIRTPLRPGAGIDDVIVVKDFGAALEAPKTREVVDALGRLGVAADAKVLIVLTAPSEVVKRSVRNLEKVKLISADQLNVFDLLHANALVLGEEALATIQEVYGDD